MQRTVCDVVTGETFTQNISAGSVVEPPLAAEVLIQRIELDNPISHRALRELIIALGNVVPAIKSTQVYGDVYACEAQISIVRESV